MIGSKLGQVLSNAAGTESIVRQFGLSVHEATVASPLITGTSADNLKKIHVHSSYQPALAALLIMFFIMRLEFSVLSQGAFGNTVTATCTDI